MLHACEYGAQAAAIHRNDTLREKYKASRAVLDMEDDLAAEMGEEIAIEVYAHTILKDIEGINDRGTPLTFSIETAKNEEVAVPGFTVEAERVHGKARITLLRKEI